MIQVIDRTCTLLEALAAAPDGMSTSELARHIHVAAPTCSNILRSLAERGYVMQTRSRGPWYLGPSARQLGQPRQAGVDPILRAADPLLTDLADGIQGSVEIVELHGGLRCFHRHVHANHPVRVDQQEIDHKPLLWSGSGRLLLAFHDDRATAERIIEQQNVLLDGTVGCEEPADINQAFTTIRRAGRVVLHDETGSPDISAGAVPLRWFGRVCLALGWYMPRYRCTDKQLRLIHSELRTAARCIEQQAPHCIKV